METFSALLAICTRNSTVIGEIPSQKPVTRNGDIFFDLRLNKRFSKQSKRQWFETQPRPLWHHCNDISPFGVKNTVKPNRSINSLWKARTVLTLYVLNFSEGTWNIYLHFMSLFHIDTTQVAKILPQIRQGPFHSTQSISWLLVSWRRKEPGHQQLWYWPC